MSLKIFHPVCAVLIPRDDSPDLNGLSAEQQALQLQLQNEILILQVGADK